MKKVSEPFLSIVIPAYNEEKILKDTLNQILLFLETKKYKWELIVADDGSNDNTSNIAKSFSGKGVRLTKLEVNQGKGAAIKKGMLVASGKYIIFMDADLSVPLKYIDHCVRKLANGFDVVVGSRRLIDSKIEIHQPFLRETMGRVYTILTKLFLFLNLSDFTCGFKGFAKNASKEIFSKSLVKRWAYDSEILFLAKIGGFSIAEIPVSWRNRSDTRVVLSGAILESFKDLVMIRVHKFLGHYD